MKHQLQPDDTDARSRPRSGVIKAAKPASLHDHEARRQRPAARSNARKAVDRASDALQDQSRRRATAPRAERLGESVPAERQEPKRSAIKSRIAERAKRQSAELDQTQPLHLSLIHI